MKLNVECVRDLLIAIEESIVLENDLERPLILLNNICEIPDMQPYSRGEIAYTSEKLIEAEFIKANVVPGDNGIEEIMYGGLTHSGHEYLENIRDLSIWEQTKKAFKEKDVSQTIPLIYKVSKKLVEKKLGIDVF